MALGGAASGIVGATDIGSVTVMQLQRAAIALVGYYKDNNNEECIEAAYKDVLAKIMVALTVDAISQGKADELIEGLQQLMKARK